MVRLGFVVCALLAGTNGALAQPLQRTEQQMLENGLDTQPENPHDWELRVGGGAILTMRDDGYTRINPLPFVSYRYEEWLAIDETQIRVNVIPADSAIGAAGFRFGPTFRVDFGRKRLDERDTQRLGHVDWGLESGFFASYAYGPARIRVRARKEFTGGHGGTTVDIDFKTGLFRAGNFGLQMGASAIWANHHYMRTFFSVTPAESALTRLPVFNAGAGFKSITPSLTGEYKITPKWAVAGSVQYVTYLDDAAASPVTHNGGRTNIGVFVLYTF